MTKLHIFDMDGTLMAGSACLELSRAAGHLEPVLEMEEAWGRGELEHIEFYEALLPLWSTLEDQDVDDVFAASPWVDGIEDVLSDIAARGEFSAVISMSPQFFVERLLACGAGSAHGASVVIGTRPKSDVVLYPEDKVRITAELSLEYGLSDDDCIAYGDSASDIPLFKHLPYSIAVNASSPLRDLASVAYDGRDLREAYAIGRSLLDARPRDRVFRA